MLCLSAPGRFQRGLPLRCATADQADSAGSGELSVEVAGVGGSGEATTATSSFASNQFTSSTVTVQEVRSTGASGAGSLKDVITAAGFLGLPPDLGWSGVLAGLRSTLMNSTGEVGTSSGSPKTIGSELRTTGAATGAGIGAGNGAGVTMGAAGVRRTFAHGAGRDQAFECACVFVWVRLGALIDDGMPEPQAPRLALGGFGNPMMSL